MKTTIAVVLIVLGVLSLVFQGITYKKREKILDIGPLQATTEKTETIPIYPVVGSLLLAGGVILLVTNNRKSSD
jgi:hypothetical protein